MSKFLRQFLQDPRTIGALAPSSKGLVKKMTRPIDFGHARVIVECGAGLGCITEALYEKMNQGATLFTFEINQVLYEDLVASFHRKYADRLTCVRESAQVTEFQDNDDKKVRFILDDARKMKAYLHRYHLRKADYVVSGLPFASLPVAVFHGVMAQVRGCLDPEGAFVQFQYTPFMYGMFRQNFREIKMSFAPINLPPAMVLDCKGPKEPAARQNLYSVAGAF